MFEWIKDLFRFKVKPTFNPTTPITPTTQEDPRVHESIKRTRAAFKQQEQAIKVRALKPHTASCEDPIGCMKEKCYVWEPDKVVNKETVSAEEYNKRRKRNIQRIKEMKRD